MGDDNIAENYLLLFDDDDDEKGDRKARRPRNAATHGRPVPPTIPSAGATSAGSVRRTPATNSSTPATATDRRTGLWSRFWRWLRHG